MGINAARVYQLGRTVTQHPVGPTLATLGVQTVRADPGDVARALAAAGVSDASEPGATLYERLGFTSVETLDVSSYEGCSHIVDLNAPELPAHLRGRFDMVYNGGTLEHVFDVRAALRNLFELLSVGGVVVHAGPANGWLDHGFYQFSPTLLADYYTANRFEPLEAQLVQLRSAGEVTVHPYVPGMLDGRPPDTFQGRWTFYMTFRKLDRSTWDAIPQQRYYTVAHGHAGQTADTAPWAYGVPFTLVQGVPVKTEIADPLTPLPEPSRGDGYTWILPLPSLADQADTPERLASSLQLFEDGVAIGPPHALHRDIRRYGGGRYSHWLDELRFSTSRNDDARRHAYAYRLAASAVGAPLVRQMTV